MAVRTDEVQLKIDFITDESRSLARTLQQTKEYNAAIQTSTAKIAEYNRELKKAGDDEAKRAPVLAKIAAEEKKIADNLGLVAAESKKVQALNLNNVAPAQLTERAKQLALAIRLIPQSAPEFKALESELAAVNGKLKELRVAASGAVPNTSGGGGIFQQILGVAGGVGLVQLAQQGISAIFNFGKAALQEVDGQLKADAQIQAAIKSTAGVAGKSLEELQTQASELQKVTLFGDDQVEQAQSLLLTFTNVRGEVFDRTVPAILDLSQAMGQDLQSSTVQVGKALNDPIKGITALTRVGVTFSEEQKKVITRLVETGDVAGAQTVILKELEKEFGGSAKAAAEAGLGPYQLLQSRIGEMQEAFAGLITNGLRAAAPFFAKVVSFAEKLTEALVSGKSATGDYATGVNAIVLVINLAVRAFQALVFIGEKTADFYKLIAEQASQFIASVQQLPVVGELFDTFLITPLRFVFDAINSLPAAWAGFQAATKQAVINVIGDLRDLYLSAQVMAKNIQSAFTFSKEAKARLTREIQDIEAQRQAAAKAGKSIGQAYVEARDAVLSQSATAAGAGSAAGAGKPAPTAPGDTDPEAARKRIEERFKNELKAVEIGIKRRELLLENERIKGLVDEQTYNERLVKITEDGLNRKLDVYRAFRREQTNEALQLQNELAVIEQGKTLKKVGTDVITPKAPAAVTSTKDNTITQALGLQDLAETNRENILRDKFTKLLITEQDYELQRLELKRQALREEIAILQQGGPEYLAEIKKKEEQALKIEEDIAKKKVENAERTEALKQKVEEASLQASAQFFSLAADLLSQDEKARKKNAGAVKAFQSAEVITSGILEAQRSYAEAVKTFGVPTGPILGGIFAGLAIGRSVLAAAKIQNTKFARGNLMEFGQMGMAKFGLFGGQPHSQGGTKGFFSDGTVVEVERDEAWAVINKKNTPILQALSAINAHGGHGVPFFQKGGIRRFDLGGFNTTPRQDLFAAAPPSVTQPLQDLSRFNAAVDRFEAVVSAFPTEVKSRVVYTEIEDAGSTLNTVRDEAGF